MADTTVVLAGVSYKVPRLNFAQRRRLQGAPGDATSFAYDFMAISMERADPKPPIFDEIEATHDEVVEALRALNELDGHAAKG